MIKSRNKKNKLKSYLTGIILFFSITLLFVLSSNDAQAASSRVLPDAYVVHTYGNDSRDYQVGELATWEDLTDVNLTSVTTTDQDSSGNTLYVTATTVFDNCELNESTISVGGQILTITGVTAGVSLTVSNITGTISSGTAVQAGFVLTAYEDGAPYNDSVEIGGATNTSADFFRVIRAADGQRGTPTSGVRFEQATVFYTILVSENYVGIYDIGAKSTRDGPGTSGGITVNGFNYVKIVGCTTYGSNNPSFNATGIYFFNITGGDLIGYIIDCVSNDNGPSSEGHGFIGYQAAGTLTLYIYNCTAKGNDYGFNNIYGTGILKNSIAQNNTNNISGTWTQTTNVTSGVTFAADGYHLASGDTGAKNLGTDLSADATFPFNDDIDEYTRTGSWDIGADELLAVQNTCAWNGSVSTVWTTAGNWTNCDGSSPESIDDVVINTAVANQPILDLTGGKTINSLSIGSSAVSTLTLSNGLVDVDVNKLTITNNLTIGGSGTITSTANTDAQTHSVNMVVGGNVDIASGGKIDVSSKGYAGGTSVHVNGYGTGGGTGGASVTYGAGGGYGGNGGNSTSLPTGGGIENGQSGLQQPTDIGSGGGYGTNAVGGAGGGAVKLNISGTLTNNGSVLATGGNSTCPNYCSGAGSGGSIWIIAGTIAGTGNIQANGGNGGAAFGYSGSGSGGRISMNGIGAGVLTPTATGGTVGGVGAAGSIYTKQNDATYGDLTFYNGGNNSPSARTITSAYGILDFNNISFNEGTAGLTNTGVTLNVYGTFFSPGSNAIDKALINSGTINLYSSGTLTISATVNNSGTINANSITTLNVSNVITNSGSFVANALENLNLSASMAMDPGKYTLPSTLNMTIDNGGILTHTANIDTRLYYINLALASLTINGTGKIDVSSKGYAGGTSVHVNGYGTGGGTGGASVTYGAGGGYGGNGGNSTSLPTGGGIENGQSGLQQPTDIGSGGGYGTNAVGGAGGGAVKLNISGTLTNNGSVLATGGNSTCSNYCSGAGSGGSIWIIAGTIAGTGNIQANGGNGGAAFGYSGSGSGGRISMNGIGAGVLTPTATGGTVGGVGGNGSIYYNVSGTYTSSVMDFSTSSKNFSTLTYNKTTTADSISTPSLTIDARAGNTATPDGSWTAWSTDIASGGNLDAFDNYSYIQYRLNLASNNAIQSPKPYDKPTANPSLQDVSVNYTAYLDKTLTSSPYNSNDAANTLANLAWDETLNTDTNIRFQIRTSADGNTWTEYLGPDGETDTYFDDANATYCSKVGSTVTCDIDETGDLGDHTNDQYFQYKAYLISETGIATPTLSSVTVTYVVNANPEFENVPTAVPNSTGDVDIDYSVRDPDTETDTVTPSFEYSLNGGADWTAITEGCLGANDLDPKTIEEVNYTPHEATWDPSCEAGISTTTYETDAQIRVTVDDGQAANDEASSASIDFILDTKPPVITDFTLDASIDPAEIDITSTDDSTYQMRIAQDTTSGSADCQTNLTNTEYETYNASPTLDLNNQDPQTICLQLKDQYDNESAVSSTDSPETPTAMMIQDTTNTLTEPDEYRLFAAWKISTDPDFNRYELYRSEDNVTFTEIFETYTIGTNSYADNTVVGDTEYYYKVKTIDSNSNQSFFSATIQAKANGIQDYGEGGGGSSEAPPIISNVEIPEATIFTSQATITWNTDIFSNSTVGYSATQGVFTTEVGTDTMYDNEEDGHYGPHTVILTNLTPDTDYYFQVKSTSVNSITGTDDNGGTGYHFKTLPGPKITEDSVSVSRITNTSATIIWETDIDASSSVTYSESVDMSDPANFLGTNEDSTNHEVIVSGLDQGTRYYFYVQSTHNGDTATDNNEYPLNSYYNFTTTEDLTAPTIDFDEDTDISTTTTTAKISFTTNEQSTSTLEYGLTDSYGTELTSDNLNINQVFDLEDLTANTTYHFKITAEDENSNTNNNSNTDYTFTTDAEEEEDETGPSISDVIVSGITYNSAIVSWVTDAVSDSAVNYGISESNYDKGNSNSFDESTTIHEVLLNGLNSVTTYYYRVRSMDAENNITTKSTDSPTSNPDNGNLLTFTTLPPTEDTDQDGTGDQLTDIMNQIQEMIDQYFFSAQEIQDALSGLYSISISSSGPSVDVTDNIATISWTTNREAIGKVYYWQESDNQDTARSENENITIATTNHEIILKNLNADTKYSYYVESIGLLNESTTSTTSSFTTEDIPQISGISIENVTLNSADISWSTTDSVDSSVLQYGEDTSYGNEEEGETSSSLHTVNLTNLKTNTTYHLRVSGEDSDGQTITSNDYSFTTVSLPTISDVKVQDITTETAVITWSTNVKTDSRVEFKRENQDKGTTQGNLEAVTDHSFTLTNLYPGSKYTFKVSSKDALNNESSSEENSFTTEEDLNPPQITNVKSDTTVFPGKEAQIQTIISWNTDKNATSVLAYREGVQKDPSLDEQLKNKDVQKIENWKLTKKNELTKNHLFVLTDLKPASLYQFKVVSFDKHDNLAISENFSLLTPTKQQSVLDLIIENFETTFGWVKKIGN